MDQLLSAIAPVPVFKALDNLPEIRDLKRASLVAALDREQDRWCREPMRWGVDDCALAVANICREALGYDPVEAYRGLYADREGAFRSLGRMGLGFALKRMAKIHGWTRVKPEEAMPGDVGLAVQDGIPVTLICRAPGWFIGRSETGATLLPAINRAVPGRSVKLCWSLV